jgi:hypothetical protein
MVAAAGASAFAGRHLPTLRWRSMITLYQVPAPTLYLTDEVKRWMLWFDSGCLQ